MTTSNVNNGYTIARKHTRAHTHTNSLSLSHTHTHSQFMFMVLLTSFIVTCLRFSVLWADTVPVKENNETKQRDVNFRDLFDFNRIERYSQTHAHTHAHTHATRQTFSILSIQAWKHYTLCYWVKVLFVNTMYMLGAQECCVIQ